VAVHDVLVAQLAREALRVAEQVLGLLARGRDDDDARVLDGHEVVQRDQRHERGLAVAAREQHDDLALAAGDGAHDAPLERFEREPARAGERGDRGGARPLHYSDRHG
jgi:hypothetical protein